MKNIPSYIKVTAAAPTHLAITYRRAFNTSLKAYSSTLRSPLIYKNNQKSTKTRNSRSFKHMPDALGSDGAKLAALDGIDIDDSFGEESDVGSIRNDVSNGYRSDIEHSSRGKRFSFLQFSSQFSDLSVEEKNYDHQQQQHQQQQQQQKQQTEEKEQRKQNETAVVTSTGQSHKYDTLRESFEFSDDTFALLRHDSQPGRTTVEAKRELAHELALIKELDDSFEFSDNESDSSQLKIKQEQCHKNPIEVIATLLQQKPNLNTSQHLNIPAVKNEVSQSSGFSDEDDEALLAAADAAAAAAAAATTTAATTKQVRSMSVSPNIPRKNGASPPHPSLASIKATTCLPVSQSAPAPAPAPTPTPVSIPVPISASTPTEVPSSNPQTSHDRLSTQSSSIKAPPRQAAARNYVITSSPSKTGSPGKKRKSHMELSPILNNINNISPPALPYKNINHEFKVPRPSARNYSVVPLLEKPSTKPVNHTILLATQKPTINNAATSREVADNLTSKKVQPIILSKEQETVLQRVLLGISLFYTGSAGTGKSVLLRSIIKALRQKYKTGVAVTASTGLAACNIGGITLHSFGGIGLGSGTVDSLVKKIRRNKKATKRWMETKVLIIDEVSMVDGELLDKLNEIAKKFRRNNAPFGGIQVVACGDFYQLPPVVKKTGLDGEINEDMEAFFSFECLAWKETIQQTIILKEVFRQKGDQVFIDMLNEMRDGRISDRTVREFQRLSRPLSCPRGIVPAELYATRYEVENANKRRLQALPGSESRYRAIDTGTLPEPQKSTLLANFLAPQELSLKKDAQVMCIKNFDETLVNGSLGTIIDFMDKDTYMKAFGPETGSGAGVGAGAEPALDENGKLKDFVFNDDEFSAVTTGSLTQKNLSEEEKQKAERKSKLHDDLKGDFKDRKFPLVKFLAPDGVNTRIVLVEPEEWTVEDEDGHVLVSRTQFPLMLAWSLSIHKSQGQTLTKVKVDLKKVFETGQSYVALSRATSREGLQVLNFNAFKVRSHPKVVKFYKSLAEVSTNLDGFIGHNTGVGGQRKLNFTRV